MIKQVPGKRAGGAAEPAPESNRLTVTTEQVQAVKKELAGIMQELGISQASVEMDQEITVEVDPRAAALCQIYVRGLRRSERMAKATGITAEKLHTVETRTRALGGLLLALDQFRTKLVGSRLVVAAAQGQLWDELVEKVETDLTSPSLPQDKRLDLKSDARELLAQAEREQVQKRQRLDDLKTARQDAKETVADAAKRRRNLQGLLRVQQDETIEEEVMDELWRIYEDQVRVRGEDQRHSKR